MIVPRLYEDLSVLHQNTMPDRAYYVPSSTRGDRLAWHRESSDRLQMLSGCEWRFAWYPSIHDLQIHAGHTFTILNGTGTPKPRAPS